MVDGADFVFFKLVFPAAEGIVRPEAGAERVKLKIRLDRIIFFCLIPSCGEEVYSFTFSDEESLVEGMAPKLRDFLIFRPRE